MPHATTPAPYRLSLVLGCLAGALIPAAVQADEPIDTLMYHSPEFPTPRVVRTYSEKLPGLWLQALDRPEVELRCQAALAIAKAREGGMSGLDGTIPALKRELSRADQQPSVRLAVARALVALDAKDAAPELFKQASSGDDDLCELIDPALARWGYGPAGEAWLQRLDRPPLSGRGMVRAIQALTILKEEKAIPRLRDLVLSAETSAAVRLEAARAAWYPAHHRRRSGRRPTGGGPFAAGPAWPHGGGRSASAPFGRRSRAAVAEARTRQ